MVRLLRYRLRVGRSLLLLLVVALSGTAQAAGTSQEKILLKKIVRLDGPSARASPIVTTSKGDIAVIAHALHVTDAYKFEVGSDTLVDAYSYSRGTWQKLARVNFGANSLGPNIFSPPVHVKLTGATDFLITLEAAGASPVEIVSDAGGHWRVVPFQQPGQATQPAVIDASVHGNQITSGANDCIPDCAQGKVTYTTWSYDSAAKAFEPAGSRPTGPCKGTLSVGPFTLTGTCFRRQGTTSEWVAQGSIRLDGVGIQTQGATTITIAPLSESVTATGPVSISLGSITIYQGTLNLSLAGNLSVGAKGKVKIKGLPISGNFQMKPTAAGMQVTAFAGIDGFTGNLTLLVSNDGTLDLTKLRLALGNLPFKQLVIKNASLTYQHVQDGDEWTGDVKVQLPGSLPSVDGTLSILNGKLEDVGATASGINKPIGDVVFLQSLGLNLGFIPRFSATGSVGLSAGPNLPVLNSPAVALNASLEADFGQPVVLTATGTLTVAGNVQLAQAKAVWTIPDKFTFSGMAGFSLGGASVNFTGSGIVDGKGFGFFGNGSLSLPGHSNVQAFGYLSEKGVTSCGIFTAGPVNVLLGFGYRWGDDFPSLWFDSCGALSFKTAAVANSAGAHAASADTTFHVPAGQRQTLFGATGATGYPAFTLRSPSGQVINPATGTEGPVDKGGYLWLQDPNHHGNYVVVGKPTAGTWTLIPTPGSPAIQTIGSALGASTPHVVTHTRSSGRHEILSWRATPIAGQTLDFSEVGARVATSILTTSRSSGSVRFTPTDDGSSDVRQIQTVVDVGGVPAAILRGARFTPQRPARPRRPRLRLIRRGSRILVTWSRTAGANRYNVTVKATDGRREFFQQAAAHRSITISSVFVPDRLTASVQAVGADGLAGATARATITIRKQKRTPSRRHHQPRH